MPTLSELLHQEQADIEMAAQKTAGGGSITGLSGRATEMSESMAAPRISPRSLAEQEGAIGADQLAPLPDMPHRVPFGTVEQNLAWPKVPGYRLYWFNNVPGRIKRAKEAGYVHVLDDATSQPVERVVDRRGGLIAYLMMIPVQWYVEDMRRSQAVLEDDLHQIRTGQAGPGKDDNRYLPSTGINIKSGPGSR